MKTEVFEYKIPGWALCYLVNADPSALTEEEIEMVDKFVDRENIVTVSVSDEDAYFSSYNDVGGLACNVYDCDCAVKVEV